MAYTKGPWEFTGDFVNPTDGSKDAICQFFYKDESDIPNKEANGRLIAAAPDLLEACEEAARFIAQCQKAIEANDLSLWPNEAQRLRVENSLWAAIDDAKGEAPNE